VSRRAFLAACGALAAAPLAHAAGVRFPPVVPRRLVFPRDHGAHPEFRAEWWYLTGWLDGPMGFQITFFRARPDFASDNPSSFAPRQIVLAHAALSEPKRGRLLHDQKAARAALGLAGADEDTTRVWVDDWRLELGDGAYRARVDAREFEFELSFEAQGPLLLQGDSGFSRKGHRPQEASYYYSRPHLAVRGRVNGRPASGAAWLDHEWSSAYLAPEAAGWDWCGINLASGGALMAFRMRAKSGGVHYAGGTLRSADGTLRRFAPGEIALEPLRTWRSPRTGVEYPVAMRVSAGGEEWRLEPLLDDQELDARASAGTIYWEGAVRAMRENREAGRGYLELTGYWRPMKL
jgi:predicted secreted hydrolase